MYYKNLFKNNVLMNAFLIGLLSTATYASSHASEEVRCRTSPSLELARRNTCYQNSELQDSFFTRLQQESLQKVEMLTNTPAFQEIVTELQNNASKDFAAFRTPNKEAKGELYIFISFSMGEKALLNLSREVKRFGATLVLRGFHEGSYVKTAQELQKIILETGQGVVIDPELFTLFNIAAVPTFVLTKPFQLYAQERTQTPIHDKLQGHVGARYALEAFKKEGDLQQEAQHLLEAGTTP